MPYYCTVPRCTSMAGKVKNVSFHQFPRDEELAKLWNKILKRGKPYTKYSKVCSLHFKPGDYTITSVGKNKGQWRTLRKDAIPSQNLPSESPMPQQRKSWSENSSQANPIDPQVQHVAQAIYMQTMLAMQAGGGTDGNPSIGTVPHQDDDAAQTSNDTQQDSRTTLENGFKSSYKCSECSRCFKDPDVFILHQRTHTKLSEKENLNTNADETLKSNPILANLLKCQGNNASDIQSNVLSIENQIMTAVKTSMENYIRNLLLSQSIINKDIENDSDSEKDLNESNDSSELVVDENA